MQRVAIANKASPILASQRFLHVSVNSKENVGGREYKYWTYSFSVRDEKFPIGEPDYHLINGRIIVVKELPWFLANMVVLGMFSQDIGMIEYKLRGADVTTINCFPKGDMDHYLPKYLDGSAGFGYFAEFLTTERLEGAGAKFVASSLDPEAEASASRQGQLKKIGLPIGKFVEIGRWKKALELGVECSENKWIKQHALVEKPAA